jgi:hypothetical protein
MMRRLHKIRANFDKSGECNALKWLSSIRECGRLRIALAENLFSVPWFAIPYESGPGRSVFVKNALLEAVALDKTFYLSQSDVPDKYVSVTTVISAAFSEAWLAPVPFSNRHR